MRVEIDGKAKGKGRPRFTKKGRFITTYTPKETKDYEKGIKNAVLRAIKDEDDNLYYKKLKMAIKVIYEPIKSISKKKRNELIGTYYDKKPDIDNIIKSIMDALNKVVYEDDKQIVQLIAEKFYGEQDKIIIEIEEV